MGRQQPDRRARNRSSDSELEFHGPQHPELRDLLCSTKWRWLEQLFLSPGRGNDRYHSAWDYGDWTRSWCGLLLRREDLPGRRAVVPGLGHSTLNDIRLLTDDAPSFCGPRMLRKSGIHETFFAVGDRSFFDSVGGLRWRQRWRWRQPWERRWWWWSALFFQRRYLHRVERLLQRDGNDG
jgi:hypothetical protein